MRYSKLMFAAVLAVLLTGLPARAQVSFGIGYGPGYYGSSGYYGGPLFYNTYGPLGYPSYPVYRSPEIRPAGGVPMIPGAVSYIDEGDYRNYRDSGGTYLGRVPLTDIPANRW